MTFLCVGSHACEAPPCLCTSHFYSQEMRCSRLTATCPSWVTQNTIAYVVLNTICTGTSCSIRFDWLSSNSTVRVNCPCLVPAVNVPCSFVKVFLEQESFTPHRMAPYMKMCTWTMSIVLCATGKVVHLQRLPFDVMYQMTEHSEEESIEIIRPSSYVYADIALACAMCFWILFICSILTGLAYLAFVSGTFAAFFVGCYMIQASSHWDNVKCFCCRRHQIVDVANEIEMTTSRENLSA